MTKFWEAYRGANPTLTEMEEYNTRVRDRVALKKARIPTAPRPQDEAEIEFMDRYKAMGIPYPDPKTVCLGDCEGTGLVPIKGDDWVDPEGGANLKSVRPTEADGAAKHDAYQQLWNEAEKRHATDDGWHLVKCPDCSGSGKRKEAEESLSSCIKDLRSLVG